MTSPDLPGRRANPPVSGSDPPPATRVDPAPGRPDAAGNGHQESAGKKRPGRDANGHARLEEGDADTDQSGLRIGSGDLAGSLAAAPTADPTADPTTAPAPSARPAVTATRGARRARLRIRRVEPWSVLKFTFLFSLCMLVIGLVAVSALYTALDRLDVFDSLNRFIRELTQQPGTNGQPSTGGLVVYFRPKMIIGGAAILGGINAIFVTAIATLGACLYNLCADITGGIEVVLAERD